MPNTQKGSTLSNGNQNGFIAVLPVLLIAAALVLVVTYSKADLTKNVTSSSVLSESTSGESDQFKTAEPQKTEEPRIESSGKRTPEVMPTQRGSENSGRGKPSGSPPFGRSPKPSRSPESARSPKPLQSLEPQETKQPEPETENQNKLETEVKEGSHSARVKIEQRADSIHLEQENSSLKVQNDTPLTVNPETKELTITTPAGEKTVTVLPDTAAEHILKTGVVNTIVKDETGKNDVKIATGPAGSPVYEIEGVKQEKLFGLVNVLIKKKAQVSLESGKVVKLDQTFASRLLDLLSK